MAAMDLCDGTLVDGVRSGNDAQFAVMPDFHTDVQPHHGGCLVSMSSGNANATNPTGTSFGNTYPDPNPADPMSELVYDLAQLRVTLEPPKNVKGFAFDFMFMSTEWPEFLCQVYDDTFYGIVTTQAINGGAPANVSYDPQNRPISVNVGFFELPREWTTPIDGTPYGEPLGFDSSCPFPTGNCVLPEYCADHPEGALGYQGSTTGWLTTSAPISPLDETIFVVFSIHDESDGVLDSLVLIDNFRWTPYEPEVTTVKEPESDEDPFGF
jgi:hypothetical protein